MLNIEYKSLFVLNIQHFLHFSYVVLCYVLFCYAMQCYAILCYVIILYNMLYRDYFMVGERTIFIHELVVKIRYNERVSAANE